MNELGLRIHRWATRQPNWALLLAIVLTGLAAMVLLGAAIALMIAQAMRPAGGHETSTAILAGSLIALALVLAIPSVYLLAYLMRNLDQWIDDPCPACRRRELEWTSGAWKPGPSPAYRTLRCRFCGAWFRQLWGSEGALSDPEPSDPLGFAALASSEHPPRPYPEDFAPNGEPGK